MQLTRLQQELANVRFQLDFETDRLEREILRLQTRLRDVEMRRSTGPVPPPIVHPDPVATEGRGEVRAQRFVVQDAQGRLRAVLRVSDRFGPMLTLMSVHGDVEMMLSAGTAGPRLELFDDTARLRVWLGLRDNVPELSLVQPRTPERD